MRPLADLHTHSVASGHAFSTISELAAAAEARGLELIAVCDHGPGLPGAPHEWYFGNLKAVPSRLGDVWVLKGVEANLMAPDHPRNVHGTGIDLDDYRLSVLDIVAIGLHPECGWDGASERDITDSLVAATANPLVDMVTHAGNHEYPVDVEAVVAAAVRHGVIVEINNASYDTVSKRATDTTRERDLVAAAVRAGALVAIGSDAHHSTRVGVFDHALRVAEEYGVDPENVVSRDAATVIAHLTARRERPRLDLSAGA